MIHSLADLADSGSKTEAAVVAALATLATQPQTVAVIPGMNALAIPNGITVRSLEQWNAHPRHIKASVTLAHLNDLTEYLRNQIRSDEQSLGEVGGLATAVASSYSEARCPANPVVFATQETLRFQAFLDYHSPDHASWLHHTATVTLALSKRFKAWADKMDTAMPQAKFADFLEDNESDIIPPTDNSSNMRDVALNFAATSVQTFESARVVENGDFAIVHKSETKGDQKTIVPKQFDIAVPLYEHDTIALRLTVLLRYRVENGAVSFTMKLKNIDRIKDDEWTARVTQLRESLKGLATVYEGVPPTSVAITPISG